MAATAARVRLRCEAHPPRRPALAGLSPAAAIERTVTGDDHTAEIRRWLCHALEDWDRAHLADVAELLVTELVVNAGRHGAPPITVRAMPTATGARLEVADGGDGEPRVLYPGAQAPSGRGLLLVDTMSARWGWERTGSGGKTVGRDLNAPAPVSIVRDVQSPGLTRRRASVASAEMKLAETFGEIARTLLAAHEPDETLRKIVEVAIDLIDPVEHAGIDIVERKRIIAVAPSSEVAEQIDAIQIEVDEGPCLSAIREHEVFSTDDLATDRRWPRFAARAVEETGIRSIMGFRLFADEDTIGALDLYSTQPGAFDEETVAIGSVLAAHAAVALSTARERQHLHEALRSRDVIGQAKGMLMNQSGISEREAFDVLRRASQRLNVKLREVAERVVDPKRSIDDEAE